MAQTRNVFIKGCIPGTLLILTRIVLAGGGVCIVLGWRLQFASLILGAFVLVVPDCSSSSRVYRTCVRGWIQLLDVGHHTNKQSGQMFVDSESVFSFGTKNRAEGAWITNSKGSGK